MSINSKCYLSSDVRAESVVEAIAFLCGAEKRRIDLSHGGAFATWPDRSAVQIEPNKKASQVWVSSTSDMQFFQVHISPTDCDNEQHTACLFLYPSAEYPNRILLYAGVSRFWELVERKLVDMFGGEVDDNDCDDVNVDYKHPKPRKSNSPADGKPWQDFEDAMYDLPVLFHFLDK